MAGEYLTTKQVQDLLKVDRTTVYRMMKDGRLTGVRIGQQWRFSADNVNSMLSERKTATTRAADVLPIHCVQVIQDVFADLAQVGSVTTDKYGEPLTSVSHCADFCSLLLATEKGRSACVGSWKKLAEANEKHPSFSSCHAGLQYASGRIEVNGDLLAILVSGQFFLTTADRDEQASRANDLSREHGIDKVKLTEAMGKINVLEEPKRKQISDWMEKVAHTFEQIACERADLMDRLKNIAALTGLQNQE